MDSDTLLEKFTHRQSPPLAGTESSAGALARVRYSHDAMIDLVLTNPGVSQGEIARHFGYTQAWVSRVMNSDAFLARLAQRKHDLIDPAIFATVDEKLRALASKSLDVVLDKLDAAPTADFALEAAQMATKALGYGARQNNLTVQTSFVVAMPQKAEDAQDWAGKYAGTSPRLRQMVEEIPQQSSAE